MLIWLGRFDGMWGRELSYIICLVVRLLALHMFLTPYNVSLYEEPQRLSHNSPYLPPLLYSSIELYCKPPQASASSELLKDLPPLIA